MYSWLAVYHFVPMLLVIVDTVSMHSFHSVLDFDVCDIKLLWKLKLLLFPFWCDVIMLCHQLPLCLKVLFNGVFTSSLFVMLKKAKVSVDHQPRLELRENGNRRSRKGILCNFSAGICIACVSTRIDPRTRLAWLTIG